MTATLRRSLLVPLVVVLAASARVAAEPAAPPAGERPRHVIPGGKERTISALVAPVYAQPPAGIVVGDIAVKDDRVQVSFAAHGKPGAVVLLHPSAGVRLDDEATRVGGESLGLVVAAGCTGCDATVLAWLASVTERVAAQAKEAPPQLWVEIKPAPPRPPVRPLPEMPVFEPLAPRWTPARAASMLAPLALAGALATLWLRGRRREAPSTATQSERR